MDQTNITLEDWIQRLAKKQAFIALEEQSTLRCDQLSVQLTELAQQMAEQRTITQRIEAKLDQLLDQKEDSIKIEEVKNQQQPVDDNVGMNNSFGTKFKQVDNKSELESNTEFAEEVKMNTTLVIDENFVLVNTEQENNTESAVITTDFKQVDNIPEQSKDATGDLASKELNLNNNLGQIADTLSRIELLIGAQIEKATAKHSNYLHDEGYVNWEDCHDILQSYVYVPLNLFYKTFNDMTQYYYPYPTNPELKEQIDKREILWECTFKVDRRKRFPSDGLYVNITSPIVMQFMNVILDKIKEWVKTSRYLRGESLSHIINNFMGNAKMLNQQESVYNYIRFEEKHKLIWVEK